MYARVRELLTPEERLQYLQIPPDLGEWELGTYFTFNQHDLEIIQQRRRDYNRLGFAVQLCVLRYLGWTLSDIKEVPVQVLRYIAKQINVDAESFASCGEREATKYEHLEEIRKEYGYQTFTLSEYRSLCKHLFSHAMVNGNPLHLIQLALDDLRKRKIILPSMATIERAVWETRKRTEEKIFKLLSSSLTEIQIARLDRVLTAMPESSKTYLAWLREIPGTSSPDSFLKVIDKLEYIRDLQLQVDTKGIHPNRLRQLSKIGSRYEPHSFRRFNDPKKYAILVAYLLELIQDLTDLAFEIHDRQIMILLSKGRKAQEELQKQNGKSINEKVVHFADLGAALIKARSEGIDPFVALDAVMPWDQLVASVEEAKRLARPVDYDSNIIEVGVDIDRLSLMGIVGQPKMTAQYIQVSGRVGRRPYERPGLIVTIYSNQNSRDKSHFEHFNEYHQRLYAQVETTSLTPFSTASLERGLTAVIIGFLRQRLDWQMAIYPALELSISLYN